MQIQANYFKNFLFVAVISLLLNVSVASHAGEKAQPVINNAVQAYGGEKLLQLGSLTLRDSMYQYSQWQSGHSLQGPMVTYLNRLQIEFSVDMRNHRKLFKQATHRLVGSHGSNVPTVSHRLFVDNKGTVIDHALQHYQYTNNITFENVAPAIEQMLDTLLIRQLNHDRQAAQWTDIAYIQGEVHDVLTVHQGTENEYVVYLNQKTGYLTRLLRHKSKQLHTYDFLEHKQSHGIVWAQQLLVSNQSAPVYHSRSRQIKFNSAQDGQFNVPAHYQLSPKTQPVDVSQLTVREIAPDVYFVGQYWGYSLFIDAGDYLISAGAWQMDSGSKAWLNGLEFFREKTGNNKPIKHHIVSHHHDDHMMGLSDVLAQGASLVIHPADIPAVQQHLPTPLPDEQFVPITETSHITNGKVMLFDVPNSHANHNMVVYLPEQKILFSEDMFGSSYQTAFNSPAYWPDQDAYFRLDGLTAKVQQLGLEVSHYVSSHHARVLSQTDIDEALTIQRPSQEVLLKRLFQSSDH